MKLSELTPCILCGGKLAPVFYRVTVEQVMLDNTALNQVLGLNTMFAGILRLAEVMAPQDDVTLTLQSESGLVCQDCYVESTLRVVLFPDEGGPGSED